MAATHARRGGRESSIFTMPIITLTTDFGADSPYVAAMKGVILSLSPPTTLVDVTHSVPPQDIRYAAVVLDDVTDRFPAGTIHVAVVDPGVGTDRPIVYARIGTQQFVCPDNGLLSRLAMRTRPATIVRLTESEYWLRPVSATFHGRDILAPVAARLSQGLDPEWLGVPQDRLVPFDWPQVRVLPDRIEGSVLMVDSFGNVITDVTAEMLNAVSTSAAVRVRCQGREVAGISRTYADRGLGKLLALIGSGGRLELAVVGGNAATQLNVSVGESVTVHW